MILFLINDPMIIDTLYFITAITCKKKSISLCVCECVQSNLSYIYIYDSDE